MKVTLINHTQNAVELLLFTKATRLTMSGDALKDIVCMSPEEKAAGLTYMAATIPSSWEFVDYVFLLEGVSRAYTHQQVRTRAGSYAQQTMRVLDMSGGYEYVYTERNKASAVALDIIRRHQQATQKAYAALIAAGQPPEDARGVLPTNIATNIVCKFNLRTMSELAASRTGGRTQGEYQRLVGLMCDAVIAVHPWAEQFLFQAGRDHYAALEAFAKAEWPDDLLKRGALLKIVDKMRKERK